MVGTVFLKSSTKTYPSCDALFVPVPRERRLEILRDPRMGSFGGAGLILLLLVKLAAIHGLVVGWAAESSLAGLLPSVAAPMLGRWVLVLAAALFPLARSEGMAARFCQGLGLQEVAVATLVTLLVCLAMGWPGLLLWGGASLGLLAVTHLAVARLGGLTGDVYGAIVEGVEAAVLVMACAPTLRIV